MATVKKSDDVQWTYGRSKAEGTVAKVHQEDVERNAQEATIKRKGSKSEPA